MPAPTAAEQRRLLALLAGMARTEDIETFAAQMRRDVAASHQQTPGERDELRAAEPWRAILREQGSAALPVLTGLVGEREFSPELRALRIADMVGATPPELAGKKTTCLPKYLERLAYVLTAWKLGDYYRTYPAYVEDEVRAALASPADFVRGPLTASARGTDVDDGPAFVVEDGAYLSARWPGDAYLFPKRLVAKLPSAQETEKAAK